MKHFLIISLAILALSCKKKDDETIPYKDPSYTYGKSIELYYDQEIPEGGKIYIDDIVFTAKDFPGATKDSGRYDFDNRFISTTNRYEGSIIITDHTLRMQTASKSLFGVMSKFKDGNNFIYQIMPQPTTNFPAYIKIRIHHYNNNELRIKTENYPVKITVIE